MYFHVMTDTGSLQDIEVDLEALDWLVTVSRRTAATLEQVAEDRRRAASTKLARCRGPFVQQVQDQAQRCAADELALAERCRRLAEIALDATAAARRDQVALHALPAAHPGGPTVGSGGGGGGGLGEGW